MLSGAVVAILDQAMLSATNLLIGLAFLRFGSKVDYGIYVQLFALMMLSQSLQNALVNGPMVPLAPKRRARGMRAFAAHLFRLQSLVSAVLVVLAFTGVEVAIAGFNLPALPHSVAAPFALAIAGQWLREFVRDYNFLRLSPHETFMIDGIYVGIITLSLGVGVALDWFSTTWVFAAFTLANFAAGWVGLRRTRIRPMSAHGHWQKPLGEAWALSRWTLPSVVVTWGTNWSFVYIVAGIVGVAAAAEVSAARLLMMPAGLCAVAWTAVFLPRASRWVGKGEFDTLIRVIRWSIMGLWGLIIGYACLLLVLYDLLETWVLGESYQGLRPLTLAWTAFLLSSVLQSAGTLSLVAGGHYRVLFAYTCISFVIGIPVIVTLTYSMHSLGAVIGLTVSELLLATITWSHGWPLLKSHWSASSQ